MIFLMYKDNIPVMKLSLTVYLTAILVNGYQIWDEENLPPEVVQIVTSDAKDETKYYVLGKWLEFRSIPKNISDIDSFVIEKLGLDWRSGRLIQYQGLVSLVSHFMSEKDSFSIYPQETQYFSFYDVDPRFINVWRVEKYT